MLKDADKSAQRVRREDGNTSPAKTSPIVSIVVPNYNHAAYLQQRLESILKQTYRNFELIVIDDASTDNSRSIIESYEAEGRIRAVIFYENSGSIYARWRDGAKLAQGRYLLFAGADDVCAPTMIERLVEQLEANPSIDLAFCDGWKINQNGDKIKRCHNNNPLLQESALITGTAMLEAMFVSGCVMTNASAVLIRKIAFEREGGFDVRYLYSADWFLWVKILRTSDVIYIADPLNGYRKHTESASAHTRSSIKVREYLQIMTYLKDHTECDRGILKVARASCVAKCGLVWSTQAATCLSWAERWNVLRKAKEFDKRLLAAVIIVAIRNTCHAVLAGLANGRKR